MKRINIKRIITALLMCVMSVMVSVMPSLQAAYALDIGVVGGYTDVLEDLKKDETFNADDYPVKENDYSLDVITIAESAEKELFVYVYQPSGEAVGIEASYITISNAYHNADNNHVYNLTLINRNGVFCKYLVKGFTISNEATRYYEVYDVLRPFNAEYGDKEVEGNKVTNVTYKVAKQFTITEKDGDYLVGVTGTDTIDITEKFVGYVRYEDGYNLNVTACDSHFVAFDTDKPIDNLYEASVYYTYQSYTWYIGIGSKQEYGDPLPGEKHLKGEEVVHEGHGLFAGTYTWNRIETVERFISETESTQNVYSGAVLNVTTGNKINDEAKASLQSKKWVLRFVDTDYLSTSGMSSSTISQTIVGDVKILRLKFETDGVTYNLGVVDNMQSGDVNPINTTSTSITFNDGFKILLGILLLIVLIVVLSPILPVVINVILTVIKAIVSGIIWVITLPFKLLGKIFNTKNKKP